MSVLSINSLYKSFGAISVIRALSLDIDAGMRHAIIGPNGAGKTTLFNLLTGWLEPSEGDIAFQGQSIVGLRPYSIAELGMARSFQINSLFNHLTVRENLRLAAQVFHRARLDFLSAFDGYQEVEDRVALNAERMALLDDLDKPVTELAYGVRRQLEVALSLTNEPSLLLLDEPAAGTSPSERTRLVDLITNLPESTTLLLVEHDMDLVFEIADRITVLSYGAVLADGTPEEIRQDEAVTDAYLGKHHA